MFATLRDLHGIDEAMADELEKGLEQKFVVHQRADMFATLRDLHGIDDSMADELEEGLEQKFVVTSRSTRRRPPWRAPPAARLRAHRWTCWPAA